MMEVKKSEYLLMKMERRNGGDKIYIRMQHFIILCILSVSCLYATAIDRKEAIRIADQFMFSNRQNILSECEHQVLEIDQLYRSHAACKGGYYLLPAREVCLSAFAERNFMASEKAI